MRIRFIKHAQELGFLLAEIEKLLTLRAETSTSCDDVKRQTMTKLAQVEAKIQALQHMHQALTQLLSACEQREPHEHCPMLEELVTIIDTDRDMSDTLTTLLGKGERLYYNRVVHL
jgi:DNA-binding transcriptional MerR regulator